MADVIRRQWHYRQLADHIRLIEERKDIRHPNAEGRPVLFLAIEADAVDLVKCLIAELGFDVHEEDDWGWTPLHLAANVGNEEIVRYLLEQGANPAAKNRAGGTPVYEAAYAARDNGDVLIDLMLRKCPGQDLINPQSKVGLTPLMVACWRANPRTVRYLLRNGAKQTMDCVNDRNESAFDLAVRAGCVKSASLLVRAGWKCRKKPPARKSLPQPSDKSRHHLIAVRKGITRHFQDARDWPDSVINHRYGEYRRTLLHEAADYGQELIVRKLCKNPRIDLFARNYHGRKASDLVPKNRTDIQLFLWAREQEARRWDPGIRDQGSGISQQSPDP
jgi:ankyrin repeat protein